MGKNKANYDIIMSGQLPGAELVIGLVGPVGANLKCVVKDLVLCLDKYGYASKEIHVSGLIENIVEIPSYDIANDYERTNALMTSGDEARRSTGHNSILALAVVSQIYGQRKVGRDNKLQPLPRHAYIINSLKHPDEVNALRRIYGNAFYLLGVYVAPENRLHYLKRVKNMLECDAKALMQRDESEGQIYGQRMRDTFHLSDFFVHLEDGDETEVQKTQAIIGRFLNIIFADPYRTPLFDEFAMFLAFSAATRSADLSRQIGAVIAQGEDILASGANDCPRPGGGTYWPFQHSDGSVRDVDNGRDYKHGHDRNDEEKLRLVTDVVDRLKRTWKTNIAMPEWCDEYEKLLQEALASSTIDDITEYGRVVHAEMDALLACARNGISCHGATLYSTTFPCHNCAKHIISAGIKRVVYVEPYPKSKALEFHDDAAFAGFQAANPEDRRVAFEPFVGVGPRRFFDLFSMKEGSGFPLYRKDKSTGKILNWTATDGTIRIPELPWSYLDREEIAFKIVEKHLKGTGNDQSG